MSKAACVSCADLVCGEQSKDLTNLPKNLTQTKTLLVLVKTTRSVPAGTTSHTSPSLLNSLSLLESAAQGLMRWLVASNHHVLAYTKILTVYPTFCFVQVI